MTTHTPFRALRSAKSIVLAAGVYAALLAASTAQAQLTAYGDVSQGQPTEAQFNALTPTPTAVTLVGVPPTQYTTYQTSTTTPAQTLTITTNNAVLNSKYLVRRNQQGPGSNTNDSFGGDFTVGTPLLRNVVTTNSHVPVDGMLITFSNAVSAFGFNFDPTLNVAPTDFTFRVFEGSNSTDLPRNGVVNQGQNDGSAPFFGVQEAGGNLITSLLIFGTAEPGPFTFPEQENSTPNDFAVGLLRFQISPQAPPPTVPEPGNIALLVGMALTGAGCLARRKRAFVGK